MGVKEVKYGVSPGDKIFDRWACDMDHYFSGPPNPKLLTPSFAGFAVTTSLWMKEVIVYAGRR